MIIELEGIDGAGKTTQVRLLKQSLEENGHKVLIVKDLFSFVVENAIKDGSYVLCDRGFGSLISYFEAHGFKREKLEAMLEIAVPELRPSYTILLDLPVKEALRRNMAKQSFSKFDNMGARFFERQKTAYLSLSKRPDWHVVDATRSIEELHRDVLDVLGQ